MEPLFNLISVLESPALRRAWLLEHYPTVDHALIQSLQEEAYQLESVDGRKARTMAQLVADAAELWDDRQTLAAALRMDAQALRLAEPLNALGKYQEAIRIYRALGQELLATETTVGLVAALRNLGRYDEALATNRGVISHLRAAGEQFSLGRALLNQGLITYFLGQFDAARAYYAEAYSLFAALGQQQWCAAVESNDANVLEELNEFEAAAAKYHAARRYYAAAQMSNAVARIDHNLAYLHFSLGDYQQALQLFADAREQFTAQESAIDVAFVDLYRSEIYLAFNLWRKALDLAKAARAAFESAQMPWETAQLLLNEAIALLHLDKSELALEQLRQARRLLTQSGFEHWQAVVDLYESYSYLRLQAYENATVAALRARAIFLQSGLTRRLVQTETLLGQIAFANGQIDRAATHFAAAQECAGMYALPAVTYHYHFGWARLYRAQGKYQDAHAHYQQAIVAVEQLQTKIGAEDYKTAFLSDKIEIYEEFIQFCLDQNSPAAQREAFAVFERAKMITQRYTQAAAYPTEQTTIADQQDEQWAIQRAESQLELQIRQLKRELNRYYTQFHTPDANFATISDATRLNQAIIQCEQRLSNLLDSQRGLDRSDSSTVPLRWIDLTTLQASLPSATIILEYFVTKDRLAIFCIEQQRLSVYQAPASLAHLLDLVQQVNFQISKFQLGARFRERHRRLLQHSIDGVLGQLYELLIAPIAGLLENIDQIVVVPHQLLHNLPFHAFFDGKQYLLETHDITYALSATFHYLVRQPTAPAARKSGLILGLNDALIHQAEAEAVAIAHVFPDAALHLGAAATMQRLLHQPQPRAFIHLATHGVFRVDNPAFSALKLADGWLTLQELNVARCSAPLITLSACDSGRSETLLGDKLVGFYRSFFNAGAQSVVVSLWSLDDQVAIRTMTAFYQALKGGQPVHQALRAAQLNMMATWRHPYYWAPFMLVGNPELTLCDPAPRTQPQKVMTQVGWRHRTQI